MIQTAECIRVTREDDEAHKLDLPHFKIPNINVAYLHRVVNILQAYPQGFKSGQVTISGVVLNVIFNQETALWGIWS